MDEIKRRRLQWHARRGLLELDLILARFFIQKLDQLDEEELANLQNLLLVPDRLLLDLCQGKAHLEHVGQQKLLDLIRAVAS